MTIRSYNFKSRKQELQPNIPQLLSSLLLLEDPITFLNKFEEVIQLNRQSEKDRANLHTSVSRVAKFELDSKACNRLIAIILNHTKRLGINPNQLPHLKEKSYDELYTYIEKNWPELLSKV